MGAWISKLLEQFYSKKLDIVVIGLENRLVTLLFLPSALF
jgi:hypothetical protein